MEDVYGDNVRFVWKHLPLASLHPDAPAAHVASVAAHKQGKFWEFHDKLFANQRNLKVRTPSAVTPRSSASTSNSSSRTFRTSATKQIVDADIAEARSMDLTGTPAFFINGRYLRGAQPFSGFAKLIDAELERLGRPLPESRQGP